MIQQTKAKPQETLDFILNKQVEIFFLSSPKNLFEERKLLIAVIYFEATNSVFYITNDKNSFSISIPGHLNSKSAEKTIDATKETITV